MLVALHDDAPAVFPPIVTEPLPWLAPKLDPVIVTELPDVELGDTLAMLGAGKTLKATPLLAIPLALTTTLPVVAPLGTDVIILVSLQLQGTAATPLNVTVPVP